MNAPRRSWPFAFALMLLVALLGLLPHVRFSLLVGEPTYFFSAYDEDLYVLWAFTGGGPLLPHRWLSSTILVMLSKLGGGSWGVAMALADALFPAVGALVAWLLVGHVTRRRLLRVVLALGLLFAQEFFSLGCWTIWQLPDLLGVASHTSPVHDLRDLRSAAPAWLQLVWPDYASPFLTPYRTPEPQISRAVLFGMLALLLAACAQRKKELSRGFWALGAAVNLALVATYFFAAAASVVFEALLGLALLARGHRRLAVAIGALALVGAISTSVGILAYHSGDSAQGRSFPSHLPVLTPAVLVSGLGLVLLLTTLRRSRVADVQFPFVIACFGSVLVLTNQQLVTGWMVSARDWERSVNYPLAFLGATFTGAWLLRQATVRLATLYACAGAALLAGSLALLKAQDRVFEQEFLLANLKSVAMKRAVEAVEARGVRAASWLLEDPELELMLQVRLERRIDHLLDITRVFKRPVDPLAVPDGRWARNSPYRREVFEYFARRPRTPGRVARLLEQEAQNGGGTFLWFLFDLGDFWTPMTDGRSSRADEVRKHLPAVVGDFEEYLRTGDPCWSRPVVVLTRQSLAERRSERWDEEFLVEATAGRGATLMNMHAYLQTPVARAAVVESACE